MGGNIIKELYDFPDEDDMGPVFLHGKFKDRKQAIAAARLSYRFDKFGDKKHQKFLRNTVAALTAIGGVPRMDAVQGGTGLLAPDLYRTVLGLPGRGKKAGDERVYGRGADFRQENRSDNGDLGTLK